MKILAYDTSSDVLSAAVFEGEEKIAELESRSFARHSSVLVPSLEKLLEDHHIPLARIDVLAVGLGPGSFTGLRVGIAAAKIFGYICETKIVGVSSLEAMAWDAAGFDGEIAVILDAKKGMLYAGVFRIIKGTLQIIQEPGLVGIDELVKHVKGPRLFMGNGASIYREKIVSNRLCEIADNSDAVYPKAAHIVRQAITRILRKDFLNPLNIEPLYLHPRDCNVTVRPTYGAKQ